VNRYEIERAIQRARLPAASVAILMMLLTRIDAKTGTIPYPPSLSMLARMTGLHETTVCRHLASLERQGWITRDRPPAGLAQRMHVRTGYTVHVPQAGSAGQPGQEAQGSHAGGTGQPGQEARDARAGSAVPGSQREVQSRPQRLTSDELTAIAADEISAHTARAVPDELARAAVRLVLDGRSVRDPGKYLREAIRREPGRFTPVHIPPSFRDLARLQAEAIRQSEGDK
jgi:hypothetical protein